MKKKIGVIGLKGLPAHGGAASVGEAIISELCAEYEFTIYSVRNFVFGESPFKQIIFNIKSKSAFGTGVYYTMSMLHALFLGQYDLIHIHHNSSGFIIPFLKLKYNVVLTLHGIVTNKDDLKFSRRMNHIGRVIEKIGVRCADYVTSVSANDAAVIAKKYNLNVDYIPNGINGTVSEHTNHKKGMLVFCAARIIENKGLHTLLEAMNILDDSKLSLLVIGDLNHNLLYKRRILEMAKGKNIIFTDKIFEKTRLFDKIREAEIFVFPSLHEAMSMMLLEVISLGVPIIASDIPANKEIFTEDELIFFKAGDAVDLSEKIKYSIQSDTNILMVERATKRLSEYYCWDKIIPRYKNIFYKLINNEHFDA